MARHLLWRAELHLDLQGGCTGLVGGEPWFFVCAHSLDGLCGYVVALDARGRERWRHRYGAAGCACQVSVQPHFITTRQASYVLYGHTRSGAEASRAARYMRLVDPADGSLHWTWADAGPYGLNRDVARLPDGRLLAGPHDCLVALDLATGLECWRHRGGVRTCWGTSAVADLDGDGRPEIILGTEWGNADGSSALIALTPAGQELWRRDGFAGDLGSTATFVVDADGDGQPEIAHVELDLEGRAGLDRSRLLIFDGVGSVLTALAFGGAELAVADWDGDGRLEAVGATVRRDGGHANAPEIVCLDLAAEGAKWRLPLSRWGLGNWPVLTDLDGDGRLEAVVGAGNPNGYGRTPGEPPWGDLHVLRADGSPFDRITREGAWSLCQLPLPWDERHALACLWGDGRVEAYLWD